jgi:restriction endonuclease
MLNQDEATSLLAGLIKNKHFEVSVKHVDSIKSITIKARRQSGRTTCVINAVKELHGEKSIIVVPNSKIKKHTCKKYPELKNIFFTEQEINEFNPDFIRLDNISVVFIDDYDFFINGGLVLYELLTKFGLEVIVVKIELEGYDGLPSY